MVIVISNATSVMDDPKLINRLFEAGLDIFHLRKPDENEQRVMELIKAIDQKHRHRIALHQHHHLAGEIGTKRLHYTASTRKETSEASLQQLKEDGFILSASTHSMVEFENLSKAFGYAFLSPVFDSLSKPGYKALTELRVEAAIRTTKLIALGGIGLDNCSDSRLDHMDGIALLGAVWQSNEPVLSFKQIQQQWNTPC